MKVKIIKDIKIAVSCRENQQFMKGDCHDLSDKLANRLIELDCAELFYEKQSEPVQENKMAEPVKETKPVKKKKTTKKVKKAEDD